MKCPSCTAPNSDNHRFCSACGQSLQILCNNCGFENDPGAKFCGGCGTLLDANLSEANFKPVLEVDAERRQLTVMFCDLVGSTALSEGLDPEDLRGILRRYHDAANEHITIQDGFIARYMGDGLLVYFGYPQAHENDAERAIRAGLEINRVVGEMRLDDGRALAVRIGIATGQVVVGDIVGHGAAEERAVLGDTPNLAARLQGIALPGTVVVSETTLKLAGELFHYNDLGAQQLKGISGEVAAFAVSGEGIARSRSEIVAGYDNMAMVGRDTELETLLLQWKAVAHGTSKVVWLEADAGMGKSRLTKAFEDELCSEQHKTLICYCSGAYSNSTYYALRDGLRDLLGVSADQAPSDTVAVLRQCFDNAVHQSALVHLIHDIVPDGLPNLPEDAAAVRQMLSDGLRSLLMHLSDEQPVLFVLEDAHWADPSTRNLLATLLHGGGVPGVLFLIATRPKGAMIAPAGAMTITLSELPVDAATIIVERTLNVDVMQSDLAEKIVARAGGSPLFLEELGKAMRSSASQVAIPSTLQDALMARLDSLGPDKMLAQTASVIGRRFNVRTLTVLTGKDVGTLGNAMTRLCDTGILELTDVSDQAYMFRHVLMQETAYQSMLKSSRKTLHGVLANALTDDLADLVPDHPELVAQHFTVAGDMVSAATYWENGGNRAISRHAHLEAIEFLNSAVDALTGTPEPEQYRTREIQLRTSIIASMRIVDRLDDALIQLDKAQELAESIGTLHERANLHTLRGNILFPMGASEASLAAHEKALELAREACDPEMEARSLSGLGDACFVAGDMTASRDYFEQCLLVARSSGLDDVAVPNLCMRGHVQLYLNNLYGALEDCQASATQATAMGLKRAEMIARASCYAKVSYDLGDFETSAAELRRGLELSHELGAGRFQPMYHSQLALICAHEGNITDYQSYRDQALDTLNPMSRVFAGAVSLGALANASSVLGDMDDAVQYLEQGEALIKDDAPCHNLLWFGRFAIEAAIKMENWGDVTRYASWLGGLGRKDPIPWATFFARRGHALAKLGQKSGDRKAMDDVAVLAVEARKLGHSTALKGLEPNRR